MKNECEYAGSKSCLCSVCQSMREEIKKAEEIDKVPVELENKENATVKTK